jgi:heme O synthase-like polyprenyltransferase
MMSGLSLVLYIRRTKIAARRVFLGSLAYLPLMLGMMVIDGKAEAPPAPDTFESLPENATP